MLLNCHVTLIIIVRFIITSASSAKVSVRTKTTKFDFTPVIAISPNPRIRNIKYETFLKTSIEVFKICLLENHHITRKKYFCNNCISFQYVHNNNYFPYSSVIRPFKPKVPSIKIKHQSYWVRHCSNTDEIFNFFVYSNWINNWCLTSL